MPHPTQRTQRVGDQIQRALASMVRQKVNDPRFKQISITGIDISPDLKNALVFFSQLDENNIDQTLEALNKAAGFFRRALAEELRLRHTPKLTFVYDKTLKYGSELTQLINQVNEEDPDKG
ncbi:MAG: ribosome-binding factor [Gammaproteobacteria bacterium]|nr:ribosome-binding factor [Gammaproteobacteria bacterium]